MISKLLLIHIALLIFVFFVFTTGCTHQSVQTTSQTILIKPTSPFTPTINSPEPSPTWTQVPIPSFTPRPTITLTLVPSPTHLPAKQAEKVVSDLLLNNAGCKLPCWWGVDPGKTTWEAAQKILMPIAYDFIFIEPSGNFTKIPKGNSFIASFQFPVPEDIFPYYPEHNFMVQDGLVQSIEITPGNVSGYNLNSLLNHYGQPEEIWIRTYANPMDNNLPFGVVLFYPNRGVIASYYPEGQKRGDKIYACPQQTFISILGLWNPDRSMLFEEAATEFKMDPDAWPFKRMDEVTAMDEEQFFEVFKDTDNTTCLDTPSKYWSSLP